MKPSDLVGPYTLQSQLGGAGSRVWLAVSAGRQVALRLAPVSDRAACSLLLHETQIAAGFDHPNIVRLHELAQSSAYMWIAMGYAGGTGQLTLANFRQLLLALLHVHGNAIVHGDIRPASLLLEVQGELRLANFRFARRVGQAASQEGGRSPYASPEQHLGDVLDTRADIYSAGVVLYQILTRTMPQGARPVAPSALAPGLGNNFDALVARALAPDREARFGHVFELLGAFDAACQRGVRREPGYGR
ncbi:serine/threonine protein kinase [Massilia sp. PAMC28688]|uniref:serine/threonine-protein kinase n=1 Tax=Massilia sp. PAMC28688 TaxID=2861283 RepID=UPI001C638BCC|nr:serine/threonine-protein kinase [Massilia sp. PAMC28688]QYF93291.1 serine/threonine protein kinase [Massilia sp. PAMC28688]